MRPFVHMKVRKKATYHVGRQKFLEDHGGKVHHRVDSRKLLKELNAKTKGSTVTHALHRAEEIDPTALIQLFFLFDCFLDFLELGVDFVCMTQEKQCCMSLSLFHDAWVPSASVKSSSSYMCVLV